MAYEKQEWLDGKDGNTPITAERLNHIEAGIAEKAAQGPKGDTGSQGPKGDTGSTGKQGAQGKAGSDGKDGFPSESDWNGLVARVKTLEDASSS